MNDDMNRDGAIMVIVNRDFKVLQYTPLATTVLPLSTASIGTRLTAVSSHLEIPRLEQSLRKVIEDGKTVHLDQLGPEGKLVINISPLLAEHGRIEGAVLTWYDVSRRNLHEERLEQARRQADGANQAKSRFLANMSHEIRTPLNSLVGLSQVLLESDLNNEQRESATSLCVSADHLLSLLDDILDISKIESQLLVLRNEEFHLGEVVDEVIEMMAAKVCAKGLEFVSHISLDIPQLLLGDPGRLKQILINLVGNALKFTETGQILLRCVKQKEDAKNLWILFQVSDTGPGISPEDQEHLFERFSQLDSDNGQFHAGTGLGLAISKQLASMMSGDMWVESRVGEGTTFWFNVRLEKADLAEARVENWALAEEIHKSRMLVVENNPVARKVLRDYLNSWECRFSEAASEEEAEELCRRAKQENDPFVILIMDQTLQGQEGIKLGARLMRRYMARPGLFVLMMPWGIKQPLKRLKKTGVAGVLRKPVSASELFDCLMTIHGKDPGLGRKITKKTISPNDPDVLRKRAANKILVVEDNRTNRMVALAVLRKLGYGAEAVPGGKEALKALAFTNYDLVLMDIQMPQMNGLETVKVIRDIGTDIINHEVPVLALTADATREERDRALEAGMNDYLSKPIRPKALAQVLDRYLFNTELEGPKTASKTEGLDSISDTAVFREEEAMHRLADDRNIFKKIFQSFSADIPRQILSLEEAVSQKKTQAAMDIAHTVKGSVANLSAPRCREAAQAVEEVLKNGNWGEARQRIEDLKKEVDQFILVVKKRGLV